LGATILANQPVNLLGSKSVAESFYKQSITLTPNG
jgi:hypothetical protein